MATQKKFTHDEEAELRELRAAARKRKELEKLRAEQAEADAAERSEVEAARQALERAGVDTSSIEHEVPDDDDEDDWLDEDDDEDEGPVEAEEVEVRELKLTRTTPQKKPLQLDLQEEDGTSAGVLTLPLVIPVELYEAMQSVPRPSNKNQQSRERHRNEVGIAVMAAWLNALFDAEGKALLTETGAIGQVFELWSKETGWGRQPSSRAARRAR